jgi:hypothetical protein
VFLIYDRCTAFVIVLTVLAGHHTDPLHSVKKTEVIAVVDSRYDFLSVANK